MTTGRAALAAAGAVVLLAVLAFGTIAVFTRAPGTRERAPDGPPAEVVPTGLGVAGPAAPALSAPAAAAAPASAGAPARPRPSAEATSPWDEVPVAARAYELGPELARPILSALDAARDRMGSCFDDEERALARGEGPRFDPADPPTGPAALLLLLESRAGGLDVVDAEIAYLGTSTRALAECCRHVLEGWPIVAPLATPGRRYRLKYVLQ